MAYCKFYNIPGNAVVELCEQGFNEIRKFRNENKELALYLNPGTCDWALITIWRRLPSGAKNDNTCVQYWDATVDMNETWRNAVTLEL